MEQLLAKYMKYGKLVKNDHTEITYRLIADMEEAEETVKAVRMDRWARYHLLSAWLHNWDSDAGFRDRFTQDIKQCVVERTSYEEDIRVSDVSPANEVHLIIEDGQTEIKVRDLSVILVNGIRSLVVYNDECHFYFATGINMNWYGGVLHCMQFAEIYGKHSIKIVEQEENTVTVYCSQLSTEYTGDFMKCCNCRKKQLIKHGARQCRTCRGKSLMWGDDKKREWSVNDLIRQGYKIVYA